MVKSSVGRYASVNMEQGKKYKFDSKFSNSPSCKGKSLYPLHCDGIELTTQTFEVFTLIRIIDANNYSQE